MSQHSQVDTVLCKLRADQLAFNSCSHASHILRLLHLVLSMHIACRVIALLCTRAAQVLSEPHDLRDFLCEANIMRKLRHP